jgi:hypothetical protein
MAKKRHEQNIEMSPCPFCGGTAGFTICDDEGNVRDPEYEDDPWSGLSFAIRHTVEDNPDCPIAAFEDDGGKVGTMLFGSRKAAAESWNTRYGELAT